MFQQTTKQKRINTILIAGLLASFVAIGAFPRHNFIPQVSPAEDTLVQPQYFGLTACVKTNTEALTLPWTDEMLSYQIYLPTHYDSSEKHYPVVYFLNGSKLFCDAVSGEEEWLIDETMDSLILAKRSESIVVALNDFPLLHEQEDSVINFLSSELKPLIDSVYRTVPSRAIIAGTGEYADLALIATLKQPRHFARAGVFSPTAQLETKLKAHNLTGKGYKGMIFMYRSAEPSAARVADLLAMHSSALLYVTKQQHPRRKVTPLGGWYVEFYNWVMGNGFNYIIPVKH